MKKLITALSLFALIVTLTACSGKTGESAVLKKEGIAPYELSEGEKYLLQSFNMEHTSQIISFRAPKEAVALHVNVYRLEDGETWSSIGGGGISIGTDMAASDELTGTFTMQLKENYAIDFVINAAGKASWKSDEILLDSEAMTSTTTFLQEFQDITLNTELPVALMVYDSGTRMNTGSLQYYFQPSKFEGMDLVQFVTLEFSDE